MKALQYRIFGHQPEVVNIPKPDPKPGQIRLKVTAAGLCHSDHVVMNTPEEAFRFGQLPLTLGHEGAGVVDALGDGATGVNVGDAVAVYGPWGCGQCVKCTEGKENYCVHARSMPLRPPGLGSPGALAEYMIVDDPRHLVPLHDLDPVSNVSLTDAGLTPYHAIKKSAPKLTAGSTALVIGAGGLGHVAVQILRQLTGAMVIAVDVTEAKLASALRHGAHHAIINNHETIDTIRALTGPVGVQSVFDFVGSQATVITAGAVVGVEGDISIIGIGGGQLPVGFQTTAFDVDVRSPYWGSRSELIEVLDMARRGQLEVETETFTLDEAPEAYDKLARGQIRGRAVVIPHA
ncbi:NAD(P)-dependent alcohol dehydrogenase [Rhodococcus fascians]|nr:NAD(P)-dependent alcohol dehydrogenase [Rhodococcus fascians]MBY4417874.1 NAD(P)-dependent alcohol dehydrogenase [Rhodococcus fascians]